MDFNIKLVKKPDWEYIEEVRSECETFFKTHDFSENDTHSLVMIISELMENSIKYGDFSIPETMVDISVDIHNNKVLIEVLNPVTESDRHHLQKLDRTIQWIRGYQDPFEAFIEKLRHVSKKPLHDNESGLGLVRIAYEGKAVLDFYVDEENMLNVSAIIDISNL